MITIKDAGTIANLKYFQSGINEAARNQKAGSETNRNLAEGKKMIAEKIQLQITAAAAEQ